MTLELKKINDFRELIKEREIRNDMKDFLFNLGLTDQASFVANLDRVLKGMNEVKRDNK